MRHLYALLVVGLTALACASTVTAQIDYIKAETGVYKVNQNAYGDPVPVGTAPVIEVRFEDGNYVGVGNDGESLGFLMTVGARCSERWRLNDARAAIDVSGAQWTTIDVDTDHRTLDDRNLIVAGPFQMPDIERTPAAACNAELDRRTAQGMSRGDLLRTGFYLRYPNAYRGTFELSCRDEGIGFKEPTQFGSATAELPVYIKCLPAAPTTRPGPRPPTTTLGVKQTRVWVSPAQNADYRGPCPKKLSFGGEIEYLMSSQADPVDVRYRYITDDGDQSPVYTTTFTQAGKKNVHFWQHEFAPPAAQVTVTAGAPGDQPRVVDGWVALEVVSPKPKDPQAGTAKTSFKLTCEAPEPDRVAVGGLAQRQPPPDPKARIALPLPGQAKPDLTIPLAKALPGDGRRVRVKVQNIGQQASPATQVKLFYHSGGSVTNHFGQIHALPAGKYGYMTIQLDDPAAGADKITLRVDDPNQVDEMDEGNNDYTLQ